MKDYALEYILGYLKDVLECDYISVKYDDNNLEINYRRGYLIINVEIDNNFIINNDTIQISRKCEREICNKVLRLMHKEEN